MPLYEYYCPTCGGTKERQRSVDDRDHAPGCDATEACNPGVMMLRRWGVSGVIIR